MSATAALDRMAAPSEPHNRAAGLALVRIAASAANAATIARDLKAILPDLPAGLDGHLAGLVQQGLAIAGTDGTCAATAEGQVAAVAILGLRRAKAITAAWPEIRDSALVLRALGLETAPQKAQKAVAKIDGLRLAIVQQAWKLKIRGKISASRARTALALVALERAFGNSVKGALGAKTDLSPKASRLLAAQLSRNPKDFGTDARLVAALAAEAVGAAKPDLASMQAAVVRTFLIAAEAPKRPERRKRPVAAVPEAMAPVEVRAVIAAIDDEATHTAASTEAAAFVQAVPSRPDPARFAAAVLAAAGARAEGWAGNRRAFVSQVWALIREQHPHWQLSEIEFKSMLTEAHRTELLMLANADLKDKSRMAEIQASAIAYKNTVWHYIRVEG